jgi:hypothetical protein
MGELNSSALQANRLLEDPIAYFASSKTAMHSIDRHQMYELQRAALVVRVATQIECIPMVNKLALRQKISSVSEPEDVVPLLFDHTMYKSHPVSLLQRRQFAALTAWLGKLTAVDVSMVDATSTDSIDQWLDLIAEGTDLDISYTSGTTGTMSFLPRSGSDYVTGARVNRIEALQTFGAPPGDQELNQPYHFFMRANRLRGSYRPDAYTLGAREFDHTCIARPSADLLWLAARLRFAAARGDVSRVDVPDSLLARVPEMRAAHDREIEALGEWVETIASFQGKKIIWNQFPFDIHSIAQPRVAAGIRWSFAPGSVLSVSGGSRGHDLDPDWKSEVERFTDARIAQAYGMSELPSMYYMCAAGRYHLQPTVIPFVLDPDTSHLLPRTGSQTGHLHAAMARFSRHPGVGFGRTRTLDPADCEVRQQPDAGELRFVYSASGPRYLELVGCPSALGSRRGHIELIQVPYVTAQGG